MRAFGPISGVHAVALIALACSPQAVANGPGPALGRRQADPDLVEAGVAGACGRGTDIASFL
jgi:hypothetical protein